MTESQIKDNIKKIKEQLPAQVNLIAVSKFHDEGSIMAAYEQGQRAFGESYENELTPKALHLPDDIEWHFIGHLQTKKVRKITPYIHMIHSVDSLKLLTEIEKQAAKHNRVVEVLLELRIAKEETKSGLAPHECRELLESGEWRVYDHVKICGIMMMASFVDDETQIRNEMLQAEEFFNLVKKDFFYDKDYFRHRSWGMSDDYPIAIECGATMIRIGTHIFGERDYR